MSIGEQNPEPTHSHRERTRMPRPRHLLIMGVLAVTGVVGTAYSMVDAHAAVKTGVVDVASASEAEQSGQAAVGQQAEASPACGTSAPLSPSHQGMVMAPEPCGSAVPAAPGVTKAVPAAPTGKVPFAQYQEIHADCGVTEHLSDDPIVFPGRPGVSHNHTFAGNTTTNANSTPASLLTGQTSCQDKGDKSAYWFPTLLQNGAPVDPSTVTVYYKSGVKDYRTVQPFPAGFRLVVGSMLTPDAAHFQGNWQCTGYHGNDFPASCPAGSALIVHLKAPSCWDKVNVDSDYKSHMAFPVKGVCPADWVPLPMLEIKVAYKLPGGNTGGLAYSSGGSYTFHYDFMNGWDQPRLVQLVQHCINGGRQCNGVGIDQHKP
jgi:hypothetical protein